VGHPSCAFFLASFWLKSYFGSSLKVHSGP
jgi:hypothetical protein